MSLCLCLGLALQAKSYQVISADGSLRNIVELGDWLRLTALATCQVSLPCPL